MATAVTHNYYSAIAPHTSQRHVGKEFHKKSWKTRVPEKKTSTVQSTLETLFTSGKWTRDTTIELPKVLPTEAPMISFRTNTVHGKHFNVMDGTPEVKEGYLWLGAKLPSDLKDAALRNFCTNATEFIVARMKFSLEKLGARRINASVMMKKPTGSDMALYVVVAFE
eukprot:TRINITY_DN490_c0_g1_i1.p1 TRINITY_DN490_c0_g1~~TRINITY_DN490_c0_g1_i1.p1  ORF type:complete len:167 (+),score=26.30 TRINITY_DN490_c0_g1_i1:216-716(+)